ncbi:hypothetical protein T09_2295 [Trichinella sp. T9]|nr:hypothetical protein T09_2295 [Trichinella sp. T9]
MLINGAWIRLGTTLVRHVTAGASGIWAAGKFTKVYRYICGRFRHAKGKRMKQVDAGGAKNIVGVTPRHQANCLTKQRALAFRGFGFLIWKIIPNVFRTMKYISTTHYARGPTWGVLPNHRVVCSRASNAKTCTFTPFKYVRGSLAKSYKESASPIVTHMAQVGRSSQCAWQSGT